MAKGKTGSISTVSDEDWRAESDLRTLIEAEKIKKDKKRFAAAQAKAKDQMMEAAYVASEEAE